MFIVETILGILNSSAFGADNFKVGNIIMIAISFVLLVLAVKFKFEPLLLLPIAFGMFLSNIPVGEIFHMNYFVQESSANINWAELAAHGGLLDYLYLGVKLGIYPCLIFMGVGAMTDFKPLIANPKSLLLGAAAQFGVFAAFIGAMLLGFSSLEAAAIGIIGGADGPTAILVTKDCAPHLLGAIAVAAYAYMALVPLNQPPIMKALTTQKERCVKMEQLRPVSKTEEVLFPVITCLIICMVLPDATPLIGSLMLGNLARVSGVVDRIAKTMQNELCNIVTILLGVSVGATATADAFFGSIDFSSLSAFFTSLLTSPLGILVLGLVAFALATFGGVVFGKIMYLATGGKINPLIGSAGVSAVPMAARVSQTVGQKANPSNFLLMHAMGPNVAGVIGSAIAAGVLIALFG